MLKMHLFACNFAFVPSTYRIVARADGMQNLFSHESQTRATKFHFGKLPPPVVERCVDANTCVRCYKSPVIPRVIRPQVAHREYKS